MGSLVGHLCSDNWRASLKDSVMRTNIRHIAGMSIDLQQCEHPRLIEINREHTETLSNMSRLMKSLKSLSAEPSVANFVALSPLLGGLTERAKHRFGNTKQLDVELMLLKVAWVPPLVCSRSDSAIRRIGQT